DKVIATRNKAAKVIQTLFKGLGFPAITDEEVEAATYAHGSKDMPPRNIVEDIKAAEKMMKDGITGIDVVKTLANGGYQDIAQRVLELLKQRISGDYLHTSAILDENFNVISAVNNRNDYQGPGTGYQMSDERWEEVKNISQALDPSDFDV
ncbi:MAG: propanediol dehydratase, partial [Negativicutes bacterium]|nr:propanediol dehydratase [Negativicutes bacterium]